MNKKKDKCWAEFKLTDISKGLSIEDIQHACFTLFPTPIKLPQDECKEMTLEEFILGELKDKE